MMIPRYNAESQHAASTMITPLYAFVMICRATIDARAMMLRHARAPRKDYTNLFIAHFAITPPAPRRFHAA